MKKIIIAISLLMLIFTLSANAEEIIPMYAEDGRTTYVFESEVAAYKAEGWYEAVTVYTFDGRTERISPFALNDWLAVGWYTEPVALMWAADGRTLVIGVSSVEDFKKVGWYENKADVMETVYAPDGRTQEVFKAFVDREKSVGWMDRDEFEEYLQPWVEAYFETWKGTYGGEPTGYGYSLVKNMRTGQIVDAFEFPNSYDEEYKKEYDKLSKKYSDSKYEWLGGSGIDMNTGKSKYSNINQIYSYINKYFSENSYSKDIKWVYEFNNNVYISYSTNEPIFEDYIYLGYKNNNHYIGVTGYYVTIIELTNIGDRMLITNTYNGDSYYSIAETYDIDFFLNTFELYYSQSKLDYVNLNKFELTVLTEYLLTSARFEGLIDDRSVLYLGGPTPDTPTLIGAIHKNCTIEISKLQNDNQYKLNVVFRPHYGYKDGCFDIIFTIQDGNPVLSSVNSYTI